VNLDRVLITGAWGQLGIELLRRVPPRIAATGVDLAELDITDAAAVRACVEQLRPAAIFNCAAYTAVDKAEADADAAYRVNRDGARNLAEAAQAAGAKLLHVSTDFVFDGRTWRPYRWQANAPLPRRHPTTR
jgi:dTDP-4-dehydrorhamnose reductase